MKLFMLLFFMCSGLMAGAQYTDTVEYLLDYMGNYTTVKDYKYTFYQIGYKTPEGTWHARTYYADIKVLREEGLYLDDSLKIKDGKFYSYHRNGKIKEDAYYYKGNKVGVWRVYNSDGKLIDSTRYKSNGMPVKESFTWDGDGNIIGRGIYDADGSGTGYYTYYYSDRKMRCTGKMVEGNVKDSVWMYYYRSGGVCAKVYFENDSAISWEYYTSKGEPQTTNTDSIGRMPEPGYDVYAFLGKNTRMPSEAMENGISGMFIVLVRFVVEEDGTITNVEIEKGVDKYFNREALKVMNKMPKWKRPGVMYNQRVRVYYTLPLTFKIG